MRQCDERRGISFRRSFSKKHELVGLTAQRAQLGEEAAEALRRAHDRLLVDAVAAHHGTVVKNVGDGVMATFPGAADAGARHNRREGQHPLGVRVGISLGDVTWEANDCFLTPVMDAASFPPARQEAAVAQAGGYAAGVTGSTIHNFRSYLSAPFYSRPPPLWTPKFLDGAGWRDLDTPGDSQ